MEDCLLMNDLLLRPSPSDSDAAQPVTADEPPDAAARTLLAGQYRRVTDHYTTGTAILTALHAVIGPLSERASFAQRRNREHRYRMAALRLVVSIVNHQAALEGVEPNGLFRELYPDRKHFDLPLFEVQALHGAWQRHQKGVRMAVLGHAVHPYYGTYAPSRTSHLELFGTWLSQYAGARSYGVDVGTGCGVLAFMMAKAGFERVTATDNNPNAVESVRRDVARLQAANTIEPVCADLLEAIEDRPDVIVFNPPWVRGTADDVLDQALCFQDGLFERFFDHAAERLGPEGRLVIVFSTIIRLVQPEVSHPIDAELEGDRFRLVQRLQRKVKPARGPDGSKRRTREKVEVWELARAGG